jgi:hypothetical protein
MTTIVVVGDESLESLIAGPARRHVARLPGRGIDPKASATIRHEQLLPFRRDCQR